ncbi:MAG: TIGR00296 family protein [Methanobacteriota archaeon]|nr:MAG: TIGR00296 family protein [Euryarchaeota archaeon]
MTSFSDDEGRIAVVIARSAVEGHVRNERPSEVDAPSAFEKKSGVFVTLSTHPGDELRGCIGYPEPVAPLMRALTESAISAASRDPRFPPVSVDELDRITVEVSLLTPPEEIVTEEQSSLPEQISVGEDGLIVERGGARGLLLPQVPVEWNWDPEEFLCQTCMKAGVGPDAWLMPDTRVFRFRAEVFSETEPRGNIVRRDLRERHGCSR